MTHEATLEYLVTPNGVANAGLVTAMSPFTVPLPMDFMSLFGGYPRADTSSFNSGSGFVQREFFVTLDPIAAGYGATATVALGPPPTTPISSTSDGTGAGIISSAGVIGRWPIQQPFPPNGRSIVTATVTATGAGYGAPPVLSVSGGGGKGAVLQPVMELDNTGSTSSPYVALGGSGYTSPTIKFVGGLGPGGVAATATLTVSMGVITGVSFTSLGSGYVGMPTCVITDSAGSSGSGAVVYVALSLKSIKIVNPGYGYTSTPTVVITSAYNALFPMLDVSVFYNLLTQALQNSTCGPVTSVAPSLS